MTSSKVKKIIDQHVRNSDTFLGVLDDLIYSFVLRAFMGEIEAVLEEERKGLLTLVSDEIAYELAQSEIIKLEKLLIDLKPLLEPNENDVRDIIRNRFMR